VPGALCAIGGLAFALVTAGALAQSAASNAATQPAGDVVIADFGSGVTTAQGGFFQVIGGRPDAVRDSLAELGRPPAWAWRVDVLERAGPSGVGAVIPLFDNERMAEQRRPLDISATPFLELRLLGALGRRTLRIELNPEAVPGAEVPGSVVASVDAFKLHADDWRSLVFRVSSKTAGVIRLILEGEGPAWLAVDRARFCASETPAVWQPASPDPPRPLRVATWVWTTERELAEQDRAGALLEFARSHGMTDLFVQIPYDYSDGQVKLRLAHALREFNAAARRAGIRVHALDGAPQYVLRENHGRMFALVAALDQFNKESPPEARFDALHLDNEPYILPVWKDPSTRGEIIAAYVDLNRELRGRANAAGLELGLDIPSWFDRREPTGEPSFPVETAGGTVSLLEALFGIVQNVGVMSYRERVLGPNGVVAICRDEFELARRYGVAVFTSVELGVGPRVEEGISLGRYPREYFVTQLATLRRVLGYETGCRGLAIHSYLSYRGLEEQ